MKRKKTMYLQGLLGEAQEKNLIENDLKGIGWKIESFKIIAYNFDEAQDNTYVARLSTQAELLPTLAQFELNTVMGLATYGGGGNTELLDMASVIVDELYITNCTMTATIADKRINYQIVLGQYDIDSTEQIVAQVKHSQGLA